ncbi:MAG: hypothetical protein NVV82_03120 [Sporocytophaga sp.]|nr:hypothetical protein [Sporocytophaga sp.]
MKFIKVVFYILMLVSISLSETKAQVLEPPYKREFLIGLNFNTNAGFIGGLNGKFSRLKKNNIYETFGVEIANVKHPKEAKYASSNGSPYVQQKKNYLFPVRLQYGRTIILFHKAPEEGVQVDAVFAGGLSLGILKPYTIEYDYDSYIAVEPYDPEKHTNTNKILGTGGIFSGFDQMKIVPGLNVKAGISFEFGSFTSNVSGLEIGTLIEAYPQKMVILDDINHSYQNKSVFTSLYVTIFYGRRK